MEIGVGGIVKNEFEYVFEWVAWHKIAGFSHVFLADNESNDGTREKLEALESLGHIHLLYQPTLETLSQVTAYKRIAQWSLYHTQAMLFLDADEFLVHESHEPGREADYLKGLLQEQGVGMVGINWRTFGSSGKTEYEPRPMVERFNSCSGKLEGGVNQFLKSASLTSAVMDYNPHSARLKPGYHYVDCLGEPLDDFILLVDGKFKPVAHSGRTQRVRPGPLRVHHYVIKSKQEYLEKKRKRGSAMKGALFDRGLKFFNAHDFGDDYYEFPAQRIEALNLAIAELNEEVMEQTPFSRELKGMIDKNNAEVVEGWLVDSKGSSAGLSVNVFVNGVFQGRTPVGFYRPDLHKKGISEDGNSGFRWTHSQPLKRGDEVSVSVYANRFSFNKKNGQKV